MSGFSYKETNLQLTHGILRNFNNVNKFILSLAY